MKQPHVVLRTVRSTRDPFLGPSMAPSSVPAAGNLIVETEELDSRDVSRLTTSADVIAVAPSMPMRLIEPKAISPAPEPSAPGVAWGVKAVKADTSPFTGDGMVVAVLDTGIDHTHAAFQGVEIIQKDFTGEGNGDGQGHGTHCAGTIFGRDVNGLRIGVAPGVKKALIGKVLGDQGGSSEGIISAIQWAVDNGANVISMSLGIDFTAFQAALQSSGLPAELATSKALEGYRANVQLFASMASLVKAMGGFSRVCILVAATGNESQRDVDANFEIAVSPPAVAEGFISVAALGRSTAGDALVVAPFSNTGANVAGPGVDIISAKPGGGLASMSGTSMATPHVAGLAALWGQQIRSIGAFNGVNLTGRLIGAGGYAAMQAGFDPSDVGAGLIVAPQS